MSFPTKTFIHVSKKMTKLTILPLSLLAHHLLAVPVGADDGADLAPETSEDPLFDFSHSASI